MGLQICSINSGSNANCYYVGSKDSAILVDAGLSYKETIKRLGRLEIDVAKIKAVFITHEHSDHIRGVNVMAKRLKIPIYISSKTLFNSRINRELPYFVHFKSFETIRVDDLHVTMFPKNHDAVDPHSVMVENGKQTVGVFTDIGEPCEHVVEHFKKCDAAFLEANYDEEMLINGRYPYFLKSRIMGEKGHLSNKQAFELFEQHGSDQLQHLLLSHISRDNNKPEEALKLFEGRSNGTKVIAASRYEESELITIKTM